MPRIRILACLLLITLALPAAATRRDELQALQSERSRRAEALPPGTKVARNVAYGTHRLQSMDVYVADGTVAPAPVIVMVHGGGWMIGDKASPGIVGAKATRWLPRGFVFVSVNYRMLPDFPVATQADDVAAAIAHVRRRAAAWGGDPARIVVMGHSAGAHLVALVSADPPRWRLSPWLGTVALDGAGLDVEAMMGKRHYRLYDRVFGADPAAWAAVSPAAALRAGGVPVLAVCSRVRPDNPCAQSDSFAAKARAVGVRAEVHPEGLDHAGINRELGKDGGYTRAVERFLSSLDPALARRLDSRRP
jgi:acetyl esterase/lipase